MGGGGEEATPLAAPVAPAGPETAAAPSTTPVATPPAAEKAVADSQADEAKSIETPASEAGTFKDEAELSAPPAELARVPEVPGAGPEPGVRLPLWQLAEKHRLAELNQLISRTRHFFLI